MTCAPVLFARPVKAFSLIGQNSKYAVRNQHYSVIYKAPQSHKDLEGSLKTPPKCAKGLSCV